jgi:hypothetical protein
MNAEMNKVRISTIGNAISHAMGGPLKLNRVRTIALVHGARATGYRLSRARALPQISARSRHDKPTKGQILEKIV